MTADITRPPARRAGPGRARPGRSAVRDPAVLRHPRDDGRRHQPRGGGAGLRHARADRRRRRPLAPRRADPLHLELRDDRAPAGARRSPRAALRRPLRPGDRDPDHGRRVRGGRPRAARDLRPGRRGDPPRAVVRRLRPGRHVRRRRRPPRRDPARGRLRARPGGRRGGDHAADEGAVPRLPVQPDRRRPAGRRPGRARRGSPSATTCSSTATRSTTASPTARTATGRSAPCRACASGRSSWAASRRPTR